MERHEGHRQRMKTRFANHGLDNFTDVHALELLLFYAIPQGDTEPLAQRLIDHFGSLNAVFESTIDELQKVKGVGISTAVFLNLIPQFSRRYMMSFASETPQFHSVQEIGKFFIPFFMHKRNEEVYIMCLDDANRLLGCRKIASGSISSAEISIRTVVEIALNLKATKVALAHNHPEGVALASTADKEITQELNAVLRAMDILLIDHLIIHGGDFTSVNPHH